MTNLARALEIAIEAHDGQTEKTGAPYIEHSRRVADAVETLDEKIVAYLHDVVEKGEGWSQEWLECAGFSSSVLAAVQALTRQRGEDERSFIHRTAADPLARVVKFADLEDNRSQAVSMGKSPARYDEALAMLRTELEGYSHPKAA